MKFIALIIILAACASKPKEKPQPTLVVEEAVVHKPAPKVGEVRSVDFFGEKKKYKVKSVCANLKNSTSGSVVVKLKPLNGKGSEIQAYEDGDTTGLKPCT